MYIIYIVLTVPLFENHPKNVYQKFPIKDVIQHNIPSSAGIYASNDDQDIRVRKYGEVVFNTLTSVASVFEYPKGI